MSRRVVFYISGHGFGHARRSAEVIRALLARRGDIEVVARTSAPARIFRGMDRVRVEPSELKLDFGAAEIDATVIDVPGTVAGAAALVEGLAEIVERETEYLRGTKADMIVADIPFAAGAVAAGYRAAAGRRVPALALGNFTWDWIYEPYAARFPEFGSVLQTVREAYRHFDLYMRLPFSHETALFPTVVDVPLIARAPSMPKAQVMARLGLDIGDERRRVLLGMRGGMSDDVVRNAARSAPHLLFLTLQTVPHGMPENVREMMQGDLDFTDVLSACDMVVSKLGYGLVADAIACGTGVLWPRRTDFREEEVFVPAIDAYARTREIPRADFRSGSWRTDLEALDQAAPAAARMAMNGAEVCARIIADRV